MPILKDLPDAVHFPRLAVNHEHAHLESLQPKKLFLSKN